MGMEETELSINEGKYLKIQLKKRFLKKEFSFSESGYETGK